MTAILAALVLFALAAYAGSITYDGYRFGKMPVVVKNFSPTFDRFDDVVFFWCAAAFNAALTAVFAIGGTIMLLSLALRR